MKLVAPISLIFIGSLLLFLTGSFALLSIFRPDQLPLLYVLGGVGSALLLGGLLLYAVRRARHQHLLRHGCMLPAVITDAQLDFSTRINGAPAVHLICQARDDQTGKEHTFSTRFFSTRLPQGSLQGYTIDVLFDPESPERFEVQVGSLRRRA